MLQWPDQYQVDTLDMIDGSWRKVSFEDYDTVFHVAGIAHIKETKGNIHMYYEINRDLAFETAKKAKENHVRQFIFLSSMSVYGIEIGVIDKDTPLQPNSAYAKSKAEAEELISKLQDYSFSVGILRPPMVYGKGCRGNYPRLASLAIKTPIFPKIDNKRSMIYIDNLSEFIKTLIDNRSAGLFFPQNAQYVNTSEMVKMIAEIHGKRIIMTKLFNPFLRRLNVGIMNKVFGDLVYEMSMSEYSTKYALIDYNNSIKKTEV